MPTLNLQVAASANDAFQYNTGLVTQLTSGAGSINDAGDIHGLRFTNVTIPQGATISSASLKLYFHNATYDTLTAVAACEDIDNAPAFTSAVNDIYNRTKTTATAAISFTDITSGGGVNNHYQVCDLAGAVQEVIDRPGWASGNALVVILYGWTAGDATYRHYDHDSAAAAKLDITYTVPVTGVPRQAAYYARMRL